VERREYRRVVQTLNRLSGEYTPIQQKQNNNNRTLKSFYKMSNTTHKLTAAMVAAYPNAMVIDKHEGNKSYKIAHIDLLNRFLLVLDSQDGDFLIDVSRCQLVLTSPANITDAQALEVAKEYYRDFPHYQDVSSGKHAIEDFNEMYLDGSDSLRGLIDLCRSLNIDMGYKSIPN